MRSHGRHRALFILFDNNVPKPLRRSLPEHVVRTAYDMDWERISNGRLLAAAERARFDVFVTADQNLEYQQNLTERLVSLIVLGSSQWPDVQPHCSRVVDAIRMAAPGSYAFIDIPLPPKPRRITS